MELPQPPKKIFEYNLTQTTQITQEKQDVFWIANTKYPEDGGIYVYKFGADILPTPEITPEKTEEFKRKGEEVLRLINKLLNGSGFILMPNGGQVALVPLEVYEKNNPKPDLSTRIDVLYPEKGFPTPEAVWACSLAKKFFIKQIGFLFKIKFLLLFLPNKLKILSKWLGDYNELAYAALIPYLLDDIRHSAPCRELRVFIREFLGEIGGGEIGEEASDRFAKIFATIIEYDTAYRYRIEDILSETTSEKLKTAPRREIKHLLGIFAQREFRRPLLVEKFKFVGLGLYFALLLPKVKKAFINALDKIDFTKLQLDEADRYHVLKLDGYEFLGRNIEDRVQEYVNLHNGNPPRTISIQSQ